MNKDEKDLLLSLKDYGEKLTSGIIRTAEHFQSYDEANGSELMISLIDGLQWFIEAAVACLIIDSDHELTKVNKKLEEFVEAFENQDYVLIGDLLQYELLPIIQRINDKVTDRLNS